MYDLSTPCRTTTRWHGGNRDWVGRTRISILTAFFTCSVQLSSFPVSLTLLFLSLFWFLINATWWVVYSRPCFRARLPRRRGRLWLVPRRRRRGQKFRYFLLGHCVMSHTGAQEFSQLWGTDPRHGLTRINGRLEKLKFSPNKFSTPDISNILDPNVTISPRCDSRVYNHPMVTVLIFLVV